MQYRYLEFTDGAAKTSFGCKDGEIDLVGKASDELIKELNLEKQVLYGGRIYYSTTLTKMGELGWSLKFVTPCGVNVKNGSSSTAGPIENAYVFEKER